MKIRVANASDSNASNSGSRLFSIPQTALDLIPFKEEAISQWSQMVDVSVFLEVLLDQDYAAIDESDNERKGNYKRIAESFFQTDKKIINEWLDRFSINPEQHNAHPSKAYFLNSVGMGKAAKYFIAWKEIVANALAESEFFSIAHLMETEFDISSSFLLAANLYYKQAFQVLRAYIENLVLSVYFCENPIEFSDWKNNNYRVPPMREKDRGMLTKLTKAGVISGGLSSEISLIYSELNSYIHSSEASMAFNCKF